MTKPNDTIEYRFLNMDNHQFYPTQGELLRPLQHRPKDTPVLLRALTSWKDNQCLITAGAGHYTETAARRLCQKLTGVIK